MWRSCIVPAALALGLVACAPAPRVCPPVYVATPAAVAAAPPPRERPPPPELPPWNLAVGETILVRQPGVRAYRDPSTIADVRVSPEDKEVFVVTGKAVGEGDLVLLSREGAPRTLHLVVTRTPLKYLVAQLGDLTADMPRLRLRVAGTRVLIDGVVLNAEEQARVDAIVALHPNEVGSLVTKLFAR